MVPEYSFATELLHVSSFAVNHFVVHSLASTLCCEITCCGLHLLQETQKEILVYAHEACHVFPGLEEQCEMYVNMYGPLVMGIIQQYLQPDAMCGRLGFCPLPPALH